jgi:hypothetical protein
MNKPDTLEIVNLIKRLPNSPITDRDSLNETVNLFFAVLGDLPADMAKAATIQYLSEGNPFFPMPGVLRDKAMELQMLAAGLPTAGEAWGMVLTANRPANPVFCDEGARLRDAVNNAATYWSSLKEYSKHVDECETCDLGGYRENYRHAAVAETVKLLGGRDAILTDNPAADRARFLEAYREVTAREKMKMGMTPRVAEFVESSRPALVSGELKQLSARLAK